MRKKIQKSLLLACAISFANLHAQVTIGSSENPGAGAILDLKDIVKITDASPDAGKGLLLPRVYLESETDLYPMFKNDPKYAANKAQIDKEHTGLLVYNLKELRVSTVIPAQECDPMRVETEGTVYKGMAVWTGTKWEMLLDENKNSLDIELPEESDDFFLVTDIEGNFYTAADFGEAGIWMTQNMRSRTFDTESEGYAANLKFKDTPSWGTRVEPEWSYPGAVGGDGTNPSYFEANGDIGLLYNHAAALGTSQYVSTGTQQGICPNGWRIPTYKEVKLLTETLHGDASKYTVSGQSKGNYNFFTNCGLGGIGQSPEANSLSKYQGGFALSYLTYIHLGNLYPMKFDGTLLWLSSKETLKQELVSIIDTKLNVTSREWSDDEERSQTIVRCIKKSPF